MRDNLETLYGAIADGALAVRIPKHARKELLAYLDCGLLCRGFARLSCGECGESLLVAFSCKGRGFCPSCLGRRMNATAANLMERVLPETGLRQWVLTFPFPWRWRLAQDGALFGQLTRLFVETVQAFYACRAAGEGALGAQTGTVTVAQRTSSDLRLDLRPEPQARGDEGGAAAPTATATPSTRTCTWWPWTGPGTSTAASCAGKGCLT